MSALPRKHAVGCARRDLCPVAAVVDDPECTCGLRDARRKQRNARKLFRAKVHARREARIVRERPDVAATSYALIASLTGQTNGGE